MSPHLPACAGLLLRMLQEVPAPTVWASDGPTQSTNPGVRRHCTTALAALTSVYTVEYDRLAKVLMPVVLSESTASADRMRCASAEFAFLCAVRALTT